MRRVWLAHPHGFSTTDVTIALAVTTLLTTAAAPSFDSYVSMAQYVRAEHDVTTLAVSLVRLRIDVSAEARKPQGLATYTLLVGDGERPVAAGDEEWLRLLTAPDVGHLADQLC